MSAPVATFDPPSPGAWELQSTHFSAPVSRWLAEVYPAAMIRGFKESTARYGVLLSHMEMGVIGRFMYLCPRPAGAPKTAKGPPPKLVFKLLALVHPELRRRIRTSREVFEKKPWREDVARWDGEWRPAVDRTNAALQAVDPSALGMPELIAHVEACRVALDHAVYRHHSLNVCALLPTGDFLVHASMWTGLATKELLPLLSGASPISVGASAELDVLAAALADDPESARLVASPVPAADVLASLGRASNDVGAATRAYLDVVGLRVLSGNDVSDCFALEVPEALVTAIRCRMRRGQAQDAESELARATGRVRDLVPAAHRSVFDALLEEARHTYRIRDERCYANDARTLGLARRALLEAGQRLARAGRLEAADHAFDLTPEELAAVLEGSAEPAASDVAAHARYRTTLTLADAPARVGFAPSPPLPAEWLPAGAARAMRAMLAMMSAMFDVSSRPSETTVVRGLAASPGTAEGVARLVSGPACFARVARGDILVAATTSPTYNVLLPIIAGLVTDRGGLLSHAAIVAREYGLPAVVGTVDGTKRIADGQRIRIDGGTGDVFLL